jgi:carbamate kinase
MLVILALGGNALLQRGEPLEAELQEANIEAAAVAVAAVARDHDVVVTHGNGPQVGLLALQSAAYGEVGPYPLDVLGAESEGMIGYLIERELMNHLPNRQIATLLTQVVVDADDPGFRSPTKPIGPFYDEAEAQRLGAERGWHFSRDSDRYRRVVPSPQPRRIIELDTIKLLVAAGVILICAGGGGIPVIEDATGRLRGVEAVVDKDMAAALLASGLGAGALLLLTDVEAVETDWGTPEARRIRHTSPDQLRSHQFLPGSMGPKVTAACGFVETTGGTAAIGALKDARAILEDAAGTQIRPGSGMMDWY